MQIKKAIIPALVLLASTEAAPVIFEGQEFDRPHTPGALAIMAEVGGSTAPTQVHSEHNKRTCGSHGSRPIPIVCRKPRPSAWANMAEVGGSTVFTKVHSEHNKRGLKIPIPKINLGSGLKKPPPPPPFFKDPPIPPPAAKDPPLPPPAAKDPPPPPPAAKPDRPKSDQPKPDQPKPDQPKPDQPKPDQPKPANPGTPQQGAPGAPATPQQGAPGAPQQGAPGAPQPVAPGAPQQSAGWKGPGKTTNAISNAGTIADMGGHITEGVRVGNIIAGQGDAPTTSGAPATEPMGTVDPTPTAAAGGPNPAGPDPAQATATPAPGTSPAKRETNDEQDVADCQEALSSASLSFDVPEPNTLSIGGTLSACIPMIEARLGDDQHLTVNEDSVIFTDVSEEEIQEIQQAFTV